MANARISLQTLIDWLPDNLWVKDIESRFVISNKVTATRMGLAEPAELIGKTDLELCPPEIAQKYFADEQKVIRVRAADDRHGGNVFDGAARGKTWISTTKVPLRNERNEIFGVVGVSRDITERRLADALRDGQAQILEMIAVSAPLEAVLDRLARLVESQLTGILVSILLLDKEGPTCGTARRRACRRPTPRPSTACDRPGGGSCGAAAIAGKPWSSPTSWAIRCGGTTATWRRAWAAVMLVDADPVASGRGARHVRDVFGTVREPTEAETRLVDVATRIAGIAIERKQAEDRIHFMANHDALTGLPNRALLSDRLSQAIFYAQRYDREVVVFIDLDNFKFVNDSLGHNAGDELLKQMSPAGWSNACGRPTRVVRLGGDEFVIVLFDQPKGDRQRLRALQKLRAAIAEPLMIEGHKLRVTGSIGIANYPNDGTDADTLLANADAAMYRAKEIGRDNFQFYTPELNTKVHEKFCCRRNCETRLPAPSSSCSISRKSICARRGSSRSKR